MVSGSICLNSGVFGLGTLEPSGRVSGNQLAGRLQLHLNIRMPHMMLGLIYRFLVLLGPLSDV